MPSNAYFLAKFRFDIAENEPAKNLQKFAEKIAKFAKFANFANPITLTQIRTVPAPSARPAGPRRADAPGPGEGLREGVLHLLVRRPPAGLAALRLRRRME